MNKAFTTEISLFNHLMLMRQNFDLGPVHMEVGDPREVRYPASVGLPISPYNLSLFLDRVHM